MNLSNTPLRSGNGKASLSPLRMRKADIGGNNFGNNSIRNTKRKGFIEEREVEKQCFNHAEKVAKFYV